VREKVRKAVHEGVRRRRRCPLYKAYKGQREAVRAETIGGYRTSMKNGSATYCSRFSLRLSLGGARAEHECKRVERERCGAARREGEGLAFAPLLHFAVRWVGDVGEGAMVVVGGKEVKSKRRRRWSVTRELIVKQGNHETVTKRREIAWQ
jgi:hypothetical protein